MQTLRIQAPHRFSAIVLILSVSALLMSSCSVSTDQKAPSQLLSDQHPASLTALRLEQRYPEIIDEPSLQYLQQVLRRIRSHEGTKTGFAKQPAVIIRIFESTSPFSLFAPPSALFISSGLLLELSTESELAFVLSHELAHQSLGHSLPAVKELRGQETVQWSEQLEIEADLLALKMMTKSGYHPFDALSALSKFSRAHGSQRAEDVIQRRLSKLSEQLALYVHYTKRPRFMKRYRGFALHLSEISKQ